MDFSSNCAMPRLLCYHNDCYIEIAGLTLRKSGLLPLTSAGKPVSVHTIMITIFLKNCNRISQSFYDSVIFNLPFHQLTCSCSHSACLSIHGYYRRNVKLPSGTIRLRICRVKCSGYCIRFKDIEVNDKICIARSKR